MYQKEQNYMKSTFLEVTTVIWCCVRMLDDDFEKDLRVGPDIWVPPGVADYLISRMHWIREGEQGDFQVGPPAGYKVEDLATLAYLIVSGDLVSAKELADNLPRSQMWMEPRSASLVENNMNYQLKNPFKRRKSKQRRRKRNGAAETSAQVIFSHPK